MSTSIDRPLAAYPLRATPLPFSAATFYRWADLGLITLIHIGGKTLLPDSEVQRILRGEVDLPSHVARKKAPTPKTRRGRPRKSQSQPAASA